MQRPPPRPRRAGGGRPRHRRSGWRFRTTSWTVTSPRRRTSRRALTGARTHRVRADPSGPSRDREKEVGTTQPRSAHHHESHPPA